MRIEAEKKLFTSDDIYKMYEAGILGPDDRVELLEGEVIILNPGRRHIACTNRATSFLTEALGRRAIVSIQNPIVLDIYNEPRPDVVVYKFREDFYVSMDPLPENALLLVEVSDTTLRTDRKRKLPHYAAAGVPEYWIEDLNQGLLHVFRDPEGNAYKTYVVYRRGDSVSPVAFPDVTLKVADLLG